MSTHNIHFHDIIRKLAAILLTFTTLLGSAAGDKLAIHVFFLFSSQKNRM